MIRYNGVLYTDRQDFVNKLHEDNLSDNQKQYLLALFDGTPVLSSPNNPVPQTVTARQFRTALVLAGFNLSQILDFINNLQEPQKSIVYIAWEYSNEFNRDNPILNQLSSQFGVSQEQLDQLFIAASQL